MALSSFKTVCRFSGFKIHRNFSAAFPAPSVYPHRETQRGAVSTAGYVPESRLRYSDDANTQTEFTLPRATLSAADRRRRKSSDEQRDVVWAIGKAQELCKADRYAIGSFTPDLYSQAKDALDAFLKDRDCSNLEAVNGSFDLMERLVREIAFLKNSKQSNWLCNPRYYNPFFNKWKEAAVRGEKVISARDLVKKLQTMSTQLPEFNYNIMTVNMIMYVVIKQAPPRRAPFVAESLLEFARNEATQMNSADLKPNAFTYSMLLKAWAESKLPEAPRRLEAIMIDMRPDVAPNLVSYNILLRFFAGNGEVDKVEEILEAMEHEGIKPNTQSLSEAIYCYAKVRQTEKAEKLFQRVINEHTGGTSRELNFIGECVQNILLAYLRDASSYGTTKIRKKQAVACAEALVRKIKITGIIDTESYGEFSAVS